MISISLTSLAIQAGNVTQIYPGKLIRKELIAVRSNPYDKVKFLGFKEGELAFEFRQFDRQVFEERPILEKVKVTRDRDDINDPGTSQVIPGEFIEGKIETREQRKDLGLIGLEEFQYFGVSKRTDEKGILIDDQQVILSQFENLRKKSCTIDFERKNYKTLTLELTRNDFYQKIGINYEIRGKSFPEDLEFEGKWDQSEYSPGDIAKLYLDVKNSSTKNSIFRILTRSISRWDWLDGRMYYIGDLDPGERKSLLRIFKIPRNIKPGNFYLQLGFNEQGGAKPQLPMILSVSE